MKYRCKCKVFEVHKTTINVIDGKVVKPETFCTECETYGEYIKEHKGFGSIIKRPQGTVSSKKDMI